MTSKEFEIWSLFIIFFKTTNLYTLNKKLWEKYFNLIWKRMKKIIWILRRPKYHQHRIRSEIGILLEIILNAFNKCLTVSFSTQILILAIAPLSFISVSTLYYAARCVIFKKSCNRLPEGIDVHIWYHIHGNN